jgi:O-antigen ligase
MPCNGVCEGIQQAAGLGLMGLLIAFAASGFVLLIIWALTPPSRRPFKPPPSTRLNKHGKPINPTVEYVTRMPWHKR